MRRDRILRGAVPARFGDGDHSADAMNRQKVGPQRLHDEQCRQGDGRSLGEDEPDLAHKDRGDGPRKRRGIDAKAKLYAGTAAIPAFQLLLKCTVRRKLG